MRTYIPMAQVEARDPEWAARLRTSRRKSRRRWRSENGEAQRANAKVLYFRNHDRVLAQKKAWRDANPEKFKSIKKKYTTHSRAKYMLQRTRQHAKRAGVPFDLTIEWMQARLDAGVCEMAGLAFDLESKFGQNSPSIDRKVAGGPYTQDNCRMILWSINRALNNWGEEYLVHVFKHVIARREG